MVPNFSIPMNGLQQAGWDLDKVAHRIASPKQGARSNEEPSSSTPVFDPAAETTRMAQIENTAEANMRVLSTFDELNKNILDIHA